MSKMTISEAQAFCLSRGITFYSYRLPGAQVSCFGAPVKGEVKSDKLIQGRGFIGVPFQETSVVPSFFIRGDFYFCKETEEAEEIKVLKERPLQKSDWKEPGKDVSREEYHRQVTRMISVLQDESVKKMVLARSFSLCCPAFERAPEWFEKLCLVYPEAFVFLVSLPGVMTWIGATPEIFLRQTSERAETMALAATRKAGEKGEWGEKEREEQEIVSEYIANLLPEREKWQIKGPFIKQAGQVEHLCTLFQYPGQLSMEAREYFRRTLHPTPAVGGYPHREAIRLIKEIEGTHRRYYAGYLGPIHEEGSFDWFVNLRSMEMWPDRIKLYVGGGITALSDPEKEWEETMMKSRTLLEVIGKDREDR